jgi:glutamate racemase
MRAIKRLLPHENIIYFGDTANHPYGSKSKETVLRYSSNIASFLMKENIKLLVVACHTASSQALDALKNQMDIPVIGVSQATIDALSHQSFAKKIAILATRGTIASGFYQKAFANEILGIACPLLVSLVEEGFIDHPITDLAIQEYLKPLSDIDTLILACTHFPLLYAQIQRVLPPHVNILDPSTLCANAVMQSLSEQGLLNSQASSHDTFFVSDHPDRFLLLGPTFLGFPILKKSVNFFHTRD